MRQEAQAHPVSVTGTDGAGDTPSPSFSRHRSCALEDKNPAVLGQVPKKQSETEIWVSMTTEAVILREREKLWKSKRLSTGKEDLSRGWLPGKSQVGRG